METRGTNKELLRAVELYTRQGVDDVEVHLDSRVPGAYAVRAMMCDGSRVDLLIGHSLALGPSRSFGPKDLAEDIEETHFTTWPPKFTSSSFFG